MEDDRTTNKAKDLCGRRTSIGDEAGAKGGKMVARWKETGVYERERVDRRRRGGPRYCRLIRLRYVRLAGRAVGQQLPKWSGKQYPCAELRAAAIERPPLP